ncbi:hypothetical protein JKP88DRAFT_316232 [Tribonema minus]|uniref:F-box domain-containing protein n=1 Tax=Tribonema minus TaxID=303371 RepID=A0A835YXV9_9STRA|nr:hypothetical protein JKP88DRAFT_316232 [Tribonema minus]
MQGSPLPVLGLDIWNALVSFLGTGQYLPLSSVSRAWQDSLNSSAYQKRTAFKHVCLSPHLLQWGFDTGCPAAAPVTLAAAAAAAPASTRLAVLQTARRNGCPWPPPDQHLCGALATAGDVAALRWAHGDGCPLDDSVCANAAAAGRVEALTWALAVGAQRGAEACARAAMHGQLEALRRLRGAGCAWDAWTRVLAERGGHAEVAEWARAHGAPGDDYM